MNCDVCGLSRSDQYNLEGCWGHSSSDLPDFGYIPFDELDWKDICFFSASFIEPGVFKFKLGMGMPSTFSTHGSIRTYNPLVYLRFSSLCFSTKRFNYLDYNEKSELDYRWTYILRKDYSEVKFFLEQSEVFQKTWGACSV